MQRVPLGRRQTYIRLHGTTTEKTDTFERIQDWDLMLVGCKMSCLLECNCSVSEFQVLSVLLFVSSFKARDRVEGPELRFLYKLKFCDEGLLPSTLPKHTVEDHPLSIVRGCLLNVLAFTLVVTRDTS